MHASLAPPRLFPAHAPPNRRKKRSANAITGFFAFALILAAIFVGIVNELTRWPGSLTIVAIIVAPLFVALLIGLMARLRTTSGWRVATHMYKIGAAHCAASFSMTGKLAQITIGGGQSFTFGLAGPAHSVSVFYLLKKEVLARTLVTFARNSRALVSVITFGRPTQTYRLNLTI